MFKRNDDRKPVRVEFLKQYPKISIEKYAVMAYHFENNGSCLFDSDFEDDSNNSDFSITIFNKLSDFDSQLLYLKLYYENAKNKRVMESEHSSDSLISVYNLILTGIDKIFNNETISQEDYANYANQSANIQKKATHEIVEAYENLKKTSNN